MQTLNTAWVSRIKEEPGSISFPANKIFPPQKSNLNIILFHHPLGWFEIHNQKEIRNNLRNNFDIIITGHEHIHDSFKVETESSSSLFIESMPFHDESCSESGAVAFYANENNDIIIEKILWDGHRYKTSEIIKKSDIIKGNTAGVSGFKVKPEFFSRLNDLGTGFTHPYKDSLCMNDVFVYPNIRELLDEKEKIKRKSSSSIVTESFEKIIISGDECSGKSLLLKKLYLDYINVGSVPILIDGTSIAKASKFNAENLDSIIKSQYTEIGLYELNLTSTDKILMIDDFDQIRGDSKALGGLLERLSPFFDKILVTVSDTFEITDYEYGDNQVFSDEYKRYELLKLGYRLRYELVNKWNLKKDTCSECSRTLIIENDKATKTINSMIGKNFVPSTPLFLLTMLQSMESGASTEMNTSSYGHYYQYLITSSLGASSVKKESLDEIYNYVKELSFYFYKKGYKEESSDSLWDFNQNFCSEYGLKVDTQPRLDLLIKSKILELNPINECYSFKYPYIFYYFIALYFSDNIKTESVRNIIFELINGLDRRRSVNILMFLTHHSKDEAILQAIIEKSKSLFSDIGESRMEFDTNFISNIVDRLPEISYVKSESNSHENRKKQAEQQDYHEENYDTEENYNDNEPPLSHKPDNEIDNENDTRTSSMFLKEFGLTMKSLEILGQISKNYYGSLKVEQKNELIKEAISAPLRALGYIFSLLSDDSQYVLDMIKRNVKEKIGDNEDISKDEIDNLARKAIFNFTMLMGYNIIKKISSSIGSPHLLPVIDNINRENGSNSNKLISLSTKLDLGINSSIDLLKNLSQELNSSPYAKSLLKAFVLDYLYMFEVKDSEVQRICNAAGIKYETVSKQIALDRIQKKK